MKEVHMDKQEITVLAVGDVCVNREDPDSAFAAVTDTIKAADIAFCQLETNYSERGSVLPQARTPLRAHPRNAPAIKKAGFNVVSFASNHHMDFGADALLDTIDAMRKTGIELIGVGKNIDEARRPQIVDCKGTKVAFLAYSSILPFGYWADEKKPGCAPMRGLTLYEQAEPDQPGTPALIHSFAHREDKATMVKDIQKARGQADMVMVSLHWGIHYTEGEIAAYQKEVGYAVLDAGADAILGQHAHILKPVEIYRGKPIFYSLCNFAFDLPLPAEVLNNPRRMARIKRLNASFRIDPEYKAYPFPVDSRMTMAARMTISDKKMKKVSLLPGYVDKDSTPRFLSRKDKEFGDVVSYLERITKAQGMDTRYQVDGDEIVVGLD
jgi:hypothetical protein